MHDGFHRHTLFQGHQIYKKVLFLRVLLVQKQENHLTMPELQFIFPVFTLIKAITRLFTRNSPHSTDR